ncbi:hypothetical protein CLOP_g20378, partial [Closterium sp. NIES-67]
INGELFVSCVAS